MDGPPPERKAAGELWLLTIIRIRVLIRAMYICMCNAVTDHDIRREAAAGVQTFAELQARTGCGDCCGCCQDEARATLDHARTQVLCPLPLVAA
jgi:bacterioferritin-associated ferredoxin